MSAPLRRLVSRALGRAGYELVRKGHREHASQGPFLRKFFDFLAVDCVFDVGANRGQYGRFLRKNVGFTGTIVSFEPVPSSLEKLREAAKGDSHWIVEPYALGKAPGRARFNVMANSVFSSFLSPDHSAVGLFERQNAVVEEIDVEVRTLDEVYPRLVSQVGASSCYLKLDTQGADLQVIEGGSTSASRFRGLQTEASVTPIYQGMPEFGEVLKTLRQRGFEISAFFPVNPRDNFPRMIEFDCHMINREYLPVSQRSGVTPGR